VQYYLISTRKDDETGALTLQTQISYKDQYLKQVSDFADQINQYIKQHHIKNSSAQMQQFMNWWSDTYDIAFYVSPLGWENTLAFRRTLQ